jgi:hypothetical protein
MTDEETIPTGSRGDGSSITRASGSASGAGKGTAVGLTGVAGIGIADSLAVRRESGETLLREGEMIRPTLEDQRVAKSPDRKAVDDLVMQYRIERAARRMGWVSLIMFVLFLVASVVGIFRPKYL